MVDKENFEEVEWGSRNCPNCNKFVTYGVKDKTIICDGCDFERQLIKITMTKTQLENIVNMVKNGHIVVNSENFKSKNIEFIFADDEILTSKESGLIVL